MTTSPPRGVHVPLLTPLRADGTLHLDGIAGHVDRLLEAGVEGFVALGTTGEFMDLTAAERVAVVEETVGAVAGRAPVFAGVGAVGTAEACEHARSAAGVGADGLLSLPPLYWKLDDAGVLRHFAAVADATRLPLVLYDFPTLAGTSLSPALIATAGLQIETVCGVKLSGAELRKVHAVMQAVAAQDGFSVLVGAADLILPALLAGADGTIAAIANVDPTPVIELLASVAAGELTAAAGFHARILELLAIPRLAVPSILALKAAAAELGSPIGPHVRTMPFDADHVITEARRLARQAA